MPACTVYLVVLVVQIVEAMPHTAMVAEFVEKLGTFYELVDDTTSVQKPAKGSVPEGDVPNGVAGGVALNKGPVAPVNGRAEDTPSISVSDDSSGEKTTSVSFIMHDLR